MSSFITPGYTCREKKQQAPIDEGTLIRFPSPTPGFTCSTQFPRDKAPLDSETRELAAVAFGEASACNVFEEMAAIANVLVRQQEARGFASIQSFIRTDKTFAFAAHGGNPRYAMLMNASVQMITADKDGMGAAVRAARNALSACAIDYSNGAYFWDGKDIKTKYATHSKRRHSLHGP